MQFITSASNLRGSADPLTRHFRAPVYLRTIQTMYSEYIMAGLYPGHCLVRGSTLACYSGPVV